MSERNKRKQLNGVVTSRSGDKSIKVVYFYKIPHALYKKEIKRKTVVHAHDENNTAGIGDTVLVAESRPMSKTKTWTLVEILETATQI